jgi:peptidylprolyl isomerase
LVHYSGWLEDGTLFDSSIPRGEPASPQAGGVIGLGAGIVGMKVGGKRQLIIP